MVIPPASRSCPNIEHVLNPQKPRAFRPNHMIDAVLRCSAAQRSASRRPLGTPTANEVIRADAKHIANRNRKPCQVFPAPSMITWIAFGPTIDDARDLSIQTSQRTALNAFPQPRASDGACTIVNLRTARAIRSNPDGDSSAITVCEDE